MWILRFETAFDYGGNHIYVAFVLIAASFLLENSQWHFSATPLRLVAGLYYFFVLFHYALFDGFSWMGYSINTNLWIFSKEVLRLDIFLEIFSLCVIFLALSSSTLVSSLRGQGCGIRSAQVIILLLCFVLTTVPEFFPKYYFSPWLSGGFNLIILAHAALLVVNGLKRLTVWRVVLGFFIILVLAGYRYFDSPESLLLRGLIYSAIGTLLVVVGHSYSKRRSGVSGVAFE